MKRTSLPLHRREFIRMSGGAAAAWPYAARAQPTRARIGVLASLPLPPLTRFSRKLQELGYVEGQNLQLDYRFAEGHDERYPDLAAELVAMPVDVIVTWGTPAVLAAKHITKAIPIVMGAIGEAVSTGVVSNLARPGGNITGFAAVNVQLEMKRLELLKELLPNLSRVGMLANATNPLLDATLQTFRPAAETLGLTLDLFEVHGDKEEIDTALRQMDKSRPDAVFVAADTLLLSKRAEIVAAMASAHLPAMYPFREYVEAGGLIVHAANLGDLFERAAGYVDRILKGAKPGDLPVQQATGFELVINLKTAKALGLEVPRGLGSRPPSGPAVGWAASTGRTRDCKRPWCGTPNYLLPGGGHPHMTRREFISLIGGAAAAMPLALHAQPATMPVIGFLSARSREESAHLVAAFQRGLAEQGPVEGQNVAIEYRWADGHYDRLPEQAAEFVRRPVAVLVAVGGDMTARAAISATRTIPIVAVFIGDPVANGLVVSLSRPGGNVTGVSNLNAVIESKRLGLLRELVPQAGMVGSLQNPDSPTVATQQKDLEEAARAIGLQIRFWQASTELELEATFEAMAQNQIPALHVGADAFFAGARNKLAQLAARHALPAIYSLRDVPLAGGLMSYGVDLLDTYRLVGVYAGRIIRGDRPVDLPVVQPTKFQLVLNLKTAKALGLAIPPGVLSIADEVIE